MPTIVRRALSGFGAGAAVASPPVVVRSNPLAPAPAPTSETTSGFNSSRSEASAGSVSSSRGGTGGRVTTVSWPGGSGSLVSVSGIGCSPSPSDELARSATSPARGGNAGFATSGLAAADLREPFDLRLLIGGALLCGVAGSLGQSNLDSNLLVGQLVPRD